MAGTERGHARSVVRYTEKINIYYLLSGAKLPPNTLQGEESSALYVQTGSLHARPTQCDKYNPTTVSLAVGIEHYELLMSCETEMD